MNNVFYTWVSGPKILFDFYGLLARNYEILVELPVCWSYQALLYQHAVAQLDGESPFAPEPEDDFDEEAFHKPKA